MSTTSRGYPLFTLDDNVDLAAKYNALSQAINDDIAKGQSRMQKHRDAGMNFHVAASTIATFGLYDSTNQSLVWDHSNGDFSFVSGGFHITTPGEYEWAATIAWEAPTSSSLGVHTRQIGITLNGIDVPHIHFAGRDYKTIPANFSQYLTHSSEGRLHLGADDTIYLFAYQNSGVQLDVDEILFSLARIG